MKKKNDLIQRTKHSFFIIFFACGLLSLTAFVIERSTDQTRQDIQHRGFSFYLDTDQVPNRAFPKATTASSYHFVAGKGVKFRNLEILPLRGETRKGPSYLSLQHGLEKGLVRVNETGEVGELSIDNLSKQYLFIHAGDIVKGGKQDRTLATDLIVPPLSKKVPIKSFCVEQGRWTKRGNESVGSFNKNAYILPNSKLKVAARYHRNQSAVWKEVDGVQSDMEDQVEIRGGRNSVGVVRDASSASSLQLSMESPAAKAMEEDYQKMFAKLDIKDFNGMVYAINGKVVGIDLYNHVDLFGDLWNKLLNSVIIEAISTRQEESFVNIDPKSLKSFIRQIDYSVSPKKEYPNRFTEIHTRLSSDSRLYDFTSYDLERNRDWAHISIVALNEAPVDSKRDFMSEEIDRRRR